MEEFLTCARLYELASEYIDTLERDKRIVGARYIVALKQNPNSVSDMGFLQYVESKMNGTANPV